MSEPQQFRRSRRMSNALPSAGSGRLSPSLVRRAPVPAPKLRTSAPTPSPPGSPTILGPAEAPLLPEEEEEEEDDDDDDDDAHTRETGSAKFIIITQTRPTARKPNLY